MFKFFPMSVKGDKFGDYHLIGIFGKVCIEFEFVQSINTEDGAPFLMNSYMIIPR